MISNCFNQCPKQNWQNEAALDSEKTENCTVSQMAQDEEENWARMTKAIWQCMLDLDGENCVTEEVRMEDLAKVGTNIFCGDEDRENRKEIEAVEILGLQVQIDCLTLARALLQCNGNLIKECSRALF